LSPNWPRRIGLALTKESRIAKRRIKAPADPVGGLGYMFTQHCGRLEKFKARNAINRFVPILRGIFLFKLAIYSLLSLFEHDGLMTRGR
jgi:hypothetical protein